MPAEVAPAGLDALLAALDGGRPEQPRAKLGRTLGARYHRRVRIDLDAVVVRCPDARRMREGWRSYKKGWEVRLIVRSYPEIDRLRAWLCEHALRPGAPYEKGLRLVQPVYGEDQVRTLGHLLPEVARWVSRDEVAERLLHLAANATDGRERDRAVAALVVRGLRQADISRRIGVSRQAVHQRLARARARALPAP